MAAAQLLRQRFAGSRLSGRLLMWLCAVLSGALFGSFAASPAAGATTEPAVQVNLDYQAALVGGGSAVELLVHVHCQKAETLDFGGGVTEVVGGALVQATTGNDFNSLDWRAHCHAGWQPISFPLLADGGEVLKAGIAAAGLNPSCISVKCTVTGNFEKVVKLTQQVSYDHPYATDPSAAGVSVALPSSAQLKKSAQAVNVAYRLACPPGHQPNITASLTIDQGLLGGGVTTSAPVLCDSKPHTADALAGGPGSGLHVGRAFLFAGIFDCTVTAPDGTCGVVWAWRQINIY